MEVLNKYDNTSYSESTEDTYRHKRKKFDLCTCKNLPTILFIIYFVLFTPIIIESLSYLQNIKLEYFYQNKYKLIYLSEYFGQNKWLTKSLVLISQLIFFTITLIQITLIKQRVAVPELQSERYKSYIILASSCVSTTSFLLLNFFNEESTRFTRKLGIVDNIFFTFYINSTFIYSLVSYNVIEKLADYGIHKSSFFLNMKYVILYISGIQTICYDLSLILISFYSAVIQIEIYLSTFLIINLFINSVMFLMSNLLYMFTLKYDLEYISLNLQIRPDIEYFVDVDENEKIFN